MHFLNVDSGIVNHDNTQLNWSKEVKPHVNFIHMRNVNNPKLSRLLQR